MSFSHEIKLEVLNNKMKDSQVLAFLNGLVLVSSKFEDENEIIIRLNKSDISSLVREKLLKLNIKYYLIPKNKNWIVILKKDFQIIKKVVDPQFFFAGAFVGGGSISNPDSTFYHLQISFYYDFVGKIMKEKLDLYDFDFQELTRTDKYLLYLKKNENILDFLNAIGAFKSFQYFFNLKNERDMQNNANRLANLDISNQQRLVEASIQHKKNYDYIQENNLLKFFSEEEILFYRIKSENPEMTLADLSIFLEKEYNILKTKSGLNHWLIKLRKNVANHKKEE